MSYIDIIFKKIMTEMTETYIYLPDKVLHFAIIFCKKVFKKFLHLTQKEKP